ncbi:MAG: LysR family transcriptional regulator [Verrucomicrobia bacterium]|nr:MAG: LysR family transcriptional regulator [Verrucomicrobiota bacterium]
MFCLGIDPVDWFLYGAMMIADKSRTRASLKPRFRVLRGKDIALGPGKVELLAAVAKAGSLSEAASQLRMSYMRAWTLVNTMNKCFKEPVISAVRGGRSGGGMKVTDTGRHALALYYEIQAAAVASARSPWRRLERLLRP